MAYGLSWISYGTPKITTIGPIFSGTNETVTSASGAISQPTRFTDGGITANYSEGTTENNYLTSKTRNGNNQGIDAIILPGGGISYGNQSGYEIAETEYTLKTENSTINFLYKKGEGNSITSQSSTTTAPLQTISISVISTSLRSGFISTTTNTETRSNVVSTTLIGSIKSTTFTTKTLNSTRSTRVSSNLPVTIISTSGSSEFLTYTHPLKNQLIVYDTVWLKINNPFNSTISNAVFSPNTQNTESTFGVNDLGFILQNETIILWQPPISQIQTWVVESFQTQTETFESTQTKFSTFTTSQSFFEGSSTTFSVEDWQTFTTTASTTNGSKNIISQSLNSGFTITESDADEDGNIFTFSTTIVPFDWSATTATKSSSFLSESKYSESYTSTRNNREVIYTTSTLSIEVNLLPIPSISTGGYFINDQILPWGVKKGLNFSEAKSLSTSSSEISTTTSKTSYIFSLESNTSGGSTQFNTSQGATSFTRIKGTWFKTENLTLSSPNFGPGEIAYATHQPIFLFRRAGNANLNFVTNPNREQGPIVLTLDGNEHTLILSQSIIGQEIPGFLVPVFYPSVTTVLNRAAHGGRLHPSVWSTMTLSREGENFSSTWRFENSRNETGTTYTTASGICKLRTESQFPLGIEETNWRTLGGAMQPNSNIVLFNKKAVMEVLTYDSSNSGTVFSTQENYGFVFTAANNKITVRREIPVIRGYGVTQLPLLDDGMP
jgi:hypothetical protein